MFKKLGKLILFLYVLSLTPIPLLGFGAALFWYKDGYYIEDIKSTVSSIWFEMIENYELQYLNELIGYFVGFTVFAIILLTFLVIWFKLKNRRVLKAR
ncbi:hypothetical protein [Cytobacillus gottheilii]|uniref:Uncharacterized protein n=1 Tax=Cytobacillus gottheilii TaxID=859144 RepID=A0ABX8FIX2_9BACI|nr:hypothetical protein [Cytobacillus gottheilii]QVY63926.1 hypothetical protein J1899_22395 [Cytobacillus gottheilii]